MLAYVFLTAFAAGMSMGATIAGTSAAVGTVTCIGEINDLARRTRENTRSGNA